MQHWWNDTDGGNRSTLNTNITWVGLGLNHGLGDEWLATNCLIHGTVPSTILSWSPVRRARRVSSKGSKHGL